MQSQVNALLHVASGLFQDFQTEYPALKDGFLKDFERIALGCRTRGRTFFTLDLPHLESLLLRGLRDGRLQLEGPMSHRVSSRVKVPRFLSGLWLRVFNKSACLKRDVDVTALFFLRQILALGKKLQADCTFDRIQSVVGAYHDTERTLREPTLGWELDRIAVADQSVDESLRSIFDGFEPSADHQYSYHSYSDGSGCDLLLSALPKEALRDFHLHKRSVSVEDIPGLGSVHLAQALDRLDVWDLDLPLFREGLGSRCPNLAEDAFILDQIQRVADLVVGKFARFEPVLFSEDLERSGEGTGFRHGPGAVAERKKNWEKSQFPNWPHKLEGVFPYVFCGRTSTSDVRDRPINHEPASRLIAVPKTAKGPRLIAAEPVAHQWCQQLVLRYFFDQCKAHFRGHFIDFKKQSKSGDMVLRASLTGHLATVDLSDASDRLTCWTVERMFRRNPSVLAALHAARTRYLRDSISEVPSFLRLKKFASQGTATTFPVMSLVMLFIAIGVSLEGEVSWQNIWKLRDQVRVFGDDIIIPTRGYSRLLRAMELLQLKVNTTKSYATGYFRESCGTDGYLGYDVTPVKPKVVTANGPSEVQSLIDTSNNLFRKGLWRASQAVLSLIPPQVLSHLEVGKVGTDGLRGLASFVGSSVNHLDIRWNKFLHRFEARAWGIYSKSINNPREGHDAFLDFVSRRHNRFNPRIVSEYAMSRSTKSRRSWVPISSESMITLRRIGLNLPESLR